MLGCGINEKAYFINTAGKQGNQQFPQKAI